MATLNDISNVGTSYLVSSNPIPEALNPPISFYKRLERFDDTIYNIGRDSHLFRFLLALCGDAGAGDVKRKLLYPRLQYILSSTFFSDIDLLYGNAFLLPRLSNEIYFTDPKYEALTFDEWQEVYQKDSSLS